MSDMTSKAVRLWPALSWTKPKRASAVSGSARATKAVAFSAGLGKSLRTAAVMMPSVPSEPMNRSFRS